MTTKKIIVVLALAGAAYAAYIRIHENIIVRRFPNIDPKIVRKAHSIMTKRAFNGDYMYKDNSDETMDAIFLAIVEEIRSK